MSDEQTYSTVCPNMTKTEMQAVRLTLVHIKTNAWHDGSVVSGLALKRSERYT